MHILSSPFPKQWAVSALEREVFNAAATNIEKKYGTNNLILSCNWLAPDDLEKELEKKPDHIFLSILADPLDIPPNIKIILDNFSVMQFGYTTEDNFLDFWAILSARKFKEYTVDELKLNNIDKLFVSYNRKPHPHRQELVSKLISSNIKSCGIITFGTKDNIDIPTLLLQNDVHYKLDEAPSDEWAAIPNDIFSLGRLDIWQTHLINIVSETQFSPTNSQFVSEKIYKPIIGMRPFMVMASAHLCEYLKLHGFDTFEDLWPYKINVSEKLPIHVQQSQTARNIIKNLEWFHVQGINYQIELYHQIYPRLLANRNRFFEYAAEQNSNMIKLFT